MSSINLKKTSPKALLLVMLLAFVSVSALAFTPTAAQLEQFQNLPEAQQEALAEQYGVDLDSLQNDQSTQPEYEDSPEKHGNQRALDARKKRNVDKENNDRNRSFEELDVEEIPFDELSPEEQMFLEFEEDEEEDEEEEEELKHFGYDLFDNALDSFMPATDIPVPSQYVMGPGDSIIVQLYGKENTSHSFTVNREGMIQFPKLGPVSVIGLNFDELKKLISDTVNQQMIGVKASVTMGSLRSIRIFILGEAKYPGSYTVNSLSTMTNALFASGGITEVGTLRNIQLKRAGKLISKMDLYDLLLRGDTSKDSRLQPGDVIFIPSIGDTVGVRGEVRRPAIYEIKSEKNAGQIIALAGGMLSTAYPQASRIERINKNGDRTVIDVDLKTRQGKKQKIQSADEIQVFSVLETLENVVTTQGHIKRPSDFAWKEGMHFTDVVKSANAFLPNPDLNSALIIRETQPTRQIEVKVFKPSLAFYTPKGKDDPILEEGDKIILFDYETDRQELLEEIVETLRLQATSITRKQLVNVIGHVRFPGDYPFVGDMSLKDLIAMAGGLTETAFSADAELTRYSLNDNELQQVEHIKIQLSVQGNLKLQAEDSLRIMQLPNYTEKETVVVDGQVMFPGSYTIQRGETLSHVIERAGGLNEYAFAKAAMFTREGLRELEAERIEKYKEQLASDIAASNIDDQDASGKVAIADAEHLLDSLSATKPIGRMVINLAGLIENPEEHDVLLKDGDSINIPRFRQSVTVVGEVQFATSHRFSKKLNYADYVDLSGGVTQKADGNRMYVVRADGSVFLPKKCWLCRAPKMEAGDTIIVPLDADRIKPLKLWTSVSQIIYQMALGAAAISTF